MSTRWRVGTEMGGLQRRSREAKCIINVLANQVRRWSRSPLKYDVTCLIKYTPGIRLRDNVALKGVAVTDL